MITEYEKFVLRKMVWHKLIGGRHTNIENIPKGKPRDEYKTIMEAIKELDRKGYFIKKPKPDGLHISINPKRLKEIQDLIKEAEES